MAASRLRCVARPVARALSTPPASSLITTPARSFSTKLVPANALAFPSLFREFDDFFGRPPSMFREFDTQLRQFGHADVLETKDGHSIKMDIPGMKKEDVKIQIDEDNVLTLSGERSRTEDKSETNYHHTERSFGKFVRSFQLPENCKPEAVTAEVRDGVLTVNIPHAPTPARRVVDVQIGDGPTPHTEAIPATAAAAAATTTDGAAAAGESGKGSQ